MLKVNINNAISSLVGAEKHELAGVGVNVTTDCVLESAAGVVKAATPKACRVLRVEWQRHIVLAGTKADDVVEVNLDVKVYNVPGADIVADEKRVSRKRGLRARCPATDRVGLVDGVREWWQE